MYAMPHPTNLINILIDPRSCFQNYIHKTYDKCNISQIYISPQISTLSGFLKKNICFRSRLTTLLYLLFSVVKKHNLLMILSRQQQFRHNENRSRQIRKEITSYEGPRSHKNSNGTDWP